MKFLISFLSLALLCGCATSHQITANKFQGLAYGQSLPEVQKQLGGEGEFWFKIRQTNTVFECRRVYTYDTHKSFFLLFEDGSFTSLLNSENPTSSWRGFTNLTQLDFSELNLCLAGYFPPNPLSNFQFTNSVVAVEDSSGLVEGVGYAVGLAPLWVPMLPVSIPLLIHQSNKQANWYKKIDSLKTGESDVDVVQLFGEPTQKIDSNNRSIWIYKNWWGSFGFENGKLVWIMNWYEPRLIKKRG
jgi:hypothetical protein